MERNNMENLFDFKLLSSAETDTDDENKQKYKFDVVRFDGHEHISELYNFNINSKYFCFIYNSWSRLVIYNK